MRKSIIAFALALLSFGFVGPQPTQVVMVKFADRPAEPCTQAWASAAINQYDAWLQAESSGATRLSGLAVHGWLTLPQPTSYYCRLTPEGDILSCDASLIASDASRLTAASFSWSDQKLIWLIVNAFPGALAGNPMVVSSCYPDSPYVGVDSLYILAHEHGHVELSHAGSWWCPGGDVGQLYATYLDISGQGCSFFEYGDSLEVMGSPHDLTSMHFSAYARSRQGWPSSVRFAAPGDLVTLLSGAEVRIPVSSDGSVFYTMEYRPNLGVFIRIANAAPSYTVWRDFEMLVNFPSVDAFYAWPPGSAITAANPFYDPYRHIGVQFIDSNASAATLLITNSDPGVPPPQPPRPCHGRKCR